MEARLYVERRAAALAPLPSGSNDLRQPLEAGLVHAGHAVAEIGEVLSGAAPRRRSRDELTPYTSVGVAVQDVAAAALVLDAARRAGAGTEVPV